MKSNGAGHPFGIKEFFELYFSYCGTSESPLVYQRWSAISMLSVALGRKTHYKLGHSTIYPNLYLMLIGDPAVRKSTSISVAKTILKASGFTKFAASRTSAEKFILDLAEAGAENFFEESQIFVAADEFTDFVGEKNHSFISLLTKIFDAESPYEYRLKNSKSVEVVNPCVNILGGNTHAGFQFAFPPEIIHTGLLSRLLLIYARKVAIKVTEPKRGPDETKDALILLVQTIKNFYSGEIDLSPPASKAVHEIYHKFDGLDDGRFAHYTGRRHVHLIKIALCLGAITQTRVLSEEHIIWANTLLSSIEDKFSLALGEFGKSKHSEIAGKIMNFLHSSDRPLTPTDLWKYTQSDLNSIQEMNGIVEGLRIAEKIIRVGNGWMVKRKYTEALPYTDFSLLTATERPRTLEELRKEQEDLLKSMEEVERVKVESKGVELPEGL